MKEQKQKGIILTCIVLVVYLVFLCWLILFKLADSPEKIPSMRGINLIPFYYDQLAGSRFQLNEILYNVFVFIPVGFFFSALGKKKIVSGIMYSALLSLCFEVLQWCFSLGASDITDLITNIAGGALGASIFLVLEKLLKGKEVIVVSIIGAILEVLLICLMIFLIIL